MTASGTSTTGYYTTTSNTSVSGVYLSIEFRKKFGKLLVDILERELKQ